jgi:hypothetical protein
MVPAGFSGCDLYGFDTNTSAWRWLATTFNGLSSHGNSPVVLEASIAYFGYSTCISSLCERAVFAVAAVCVCPWLAGRHSTNATYHEPGQLPFPL